ncbi:MAG: hypothetical protein JWM80_1192 [Cyanobacteria bacterium RYN_339]|nr:hypothetical protein [Cyanobacteria bacterium RYN_339]
MLPLMKVAMLLATLSFLDLTGKPVPLAAVVGDRPALLVFLRHFG